MEKRQISRAEVEKHGKRDDCWIIIDDKVYDVTKYLDKHPSGPDNILNESGPGKDASEPFEYAEHSFAAKR